MRFQCIIDKARYNVGRHIFYSRIFFYLLKTIQSSLQLLISTLKICGSIVQNNLIDCFTQFPSYKYCSFYSNSISSLKIKIMVKILLNYQKAKLQQI
jgi:hypothetical protein